MRFSEVYRPCRVASFPAVSARDSLEGDGCATAHSLRWWILQPALLDWYLGNTAFDSMDS